MKKSHCIGCRDNFYNGNNPYGISRCWLLEKAKLITRYRLSINTPMNQKSGYLKEKLPNCYTENGHIFLKEIPGYAK